MKIKELPGNPFENIGTIIAYPDRTFYPGGAYKIMEIGKNIKAISDIIGQSMGGIIMYPSSVTSDLSELALYDFNFDLLGDKKYTPEFIPGMLDDYSIDTLGEDLDTVSSLIFPQISTSTDHLGPSYFGGFQDKEGNQIRLLDLPMIGNTGIWKIEIYNEKIKGNVLYDDEYYTLDYDTYTFLSEVETFEYPEFSRYDLKYKPCIQIYFGPTYSTRLTGQTLNEALSNQVYADRYMTPPDENDYQDFTNEMTEAEYVRSYKNEVVSRKILYLVYNGQGEIKVINLAETSFDLSKNPARNQHNRSSRMDDYLSYSLGATKKSGSFVFDKSSGVLIGNLGDRKFPILENRKSRILPSLRTPGITEVDIDGKKYRKGKTTEIWEDPITSPNWVLDRDIKSNYEKCYISATLGGSVSPSGAYYIRSGKTMTVTQEPVIGYRLDRIEETYQNGVTRTNTTSRTSYSYPDIPRSLKFIYDHLQYSFDIKFQYDLYEYSLSKSQSSAISSVPKVFFKDDLGNWNEYNWKESGDFLLDDASKITFKIDWTSGRFEQNGDLRG